MTTILVPFHHDERLADDTIPLSGVTVVPDLPDTGLWPRMTALHTAVAENVAADIGAGGVPTVISGDCLVMLGTLLGVQRAGIDPAVVWFDAHGDLHTSRTTTSGYLGGMAVRLAMGAEPETAPLGLRPLAEERTVLVDARDLDPAEAEYLGASAITRVGVDEVGPHVLPDGPFILHIDFDVVDSAELTGLLFPAQGGPSSIAVVRAARRLLDTGRVVAVDLACTWHPPRDAGEAEARARLLAEFA